MPHRRPRKVDGILLEPGASAWQAQGTCLRDARLHDRTCRSVTSRIADGRRRWRRAAGYVGPVRDRYVIEFKVEGPQRSGLVRSTWIVRRGETSPRLTSCFVK